MIQVIFLKLLNSKSTIPGAKDHSAVNNSKDIKEKNVSVKTSKTNCYLKILVFLHHLSVNLEIFWVRKNIFIF